jgi:peptidoglycan-associated lipoprotein
MKQIAVFLVLSVILFSSCTSLYQKGQNQFQGGDYQLAITTFSKILEDDPENKEANFYVAESYRLTNRIEQSKAYYEKVAEEEETFDTFYHLGQSLKSQGEYEKAKEAFTKARDLTLDDNYQKLLNREIDNLEKIEAIEDYFPFIEVENYRLLNTPLADYSPVVNEGYLYFTSNRASSGIYLATGTPYMKLMRTRVDGIKVDVQNIQPLPEFRNEENLNQGSLAISPDGNTLIYARANSRSPKDLPDVQLFASYFRGGGFTQPIWMPVNEDEFYTNTTPAFSPDGNELYFSSLRPDGLGGMDLYKATKLANGDFGNAVSLGPQINTMGNEMFPYVALMVNFSLLPMVILDLGNWIYLWRKRPKKVGK